MHSYSFNKKEAFPLAGLLSNIMVEAANLLSKVDIWNAWNLTKLDMRSRLTGGSVPMKKGSTANAALWSGALVAQSAGVSFGRLRCSLFSLRPQASSTQAEKLALGFTGFSRSTLASISSMSSCGKRIFFCADFAFTAFVAMLFPHGGDGPQYSKKRLTCTPTDNKVGPHHDFSNGVKNTKPGSASTHTGPLTTNDSESIEVAMQNHTTPLTWRNSLSPNKFTWRFLALSRIDREAKPCRLSVVAPTEREARQVLAPHFILSFSARLPVQEVRHA